jgi:hypothetical protein
VIKGKKIPKGAAIGLIVGGDIILLLMGWFLLVSPQRQTAKSIAQSVIATQAQIEVAQKPITQPKPLRQPTQPEIQTAYLYKLSKAMPMNQDMPNLLLELSTVVRASGVNLQSIAPSPPDPATGITSITLAVNGNFYSLTDLMYRLRGLVSVHNGALDVSGRLFTIKSVGLTAAGSGRQINGSIDLSSYTFGAAAAAAAAAPVLPTTDTTSTSTDETSTDSSASASADAGISH